MSSIQRRNTISSSSSSFKSHNNDQKNDNNSNKVAIKKRSWSCPAFNGGATRRTSSFDDSSPSSYTSMKDLLSSSLTTTTTRGDSMFFWNSTEPLDDPIPDEIPIKNELVRRAARAYLEQSWTIWRETQRKRGIWAEFEKCFGFVKTVLGAMFGRDLHGHGKIRI